MLDTGQLGLTGQALSLFRQGLAAAGAKQYERAVDLYNQALTFQADCYEVCYQRGLALEALGDYIEAIASYERALGLNPGQEAVNEILHDKGNAYQYGLGEYQKAIACYDQALKAGSLNDGIWQNRGNALLYGLSRPEDALRCYDSALRLNPENIAALRHRGNALIELRCYDDAIACYDKVLALAPNDQIAWHSRNLAAEKTGLQYEQISTKPVFYDSGFGEPTFIEGDADSDIIYTQQFTATEEAIPLGQPLLTIEDDWGRHEILLERDRYLLGRDPKSDICLHSQFVSRQHAYLAKITRSDGSPGYQLVDGNLQGKPSTNGVVVNGHKCQAVVLQTGDTVVFGPNVRATYRLSTQF
mgnify:CR=1 FL=1